MIPGLRWTFWLFFVAYSTAFNDVLRGVCRLRGITALRSSFFQSFKDKLLPPKEKCEPKSERDLFVEYVKYKPWRASKVKNLKIHYKPWKESYLERYRSPDDETIYLYGAFHLDLNSFYCR
jgi:hypothetical protein